MLLKNIYVEKSNLFAYLRRKVSIIEMLIPLNPLVYWNPVKNQNYFDCTGTTKVVNGSK